MSTTALTIKQGQTLITTDPLQLWDEAVNRYLETRKGGPAGNTAKTYGRTLTGYRSFALGRGLNPWGADALIAYNAHQHGLADLSPDTIRGRLTHIQGFFRWAFIRGATILTPEIVKDILHKPAPKQLSPRDILDPLEVEAMLKMALATDDPAQGRRAHALIRVLADAGLRVSEAVNLKANDIYLAGGRWYLHVRGKGDKSREVEIAKALVQELLALKVADSIPLLAMSRITAFRWLKRIAEEAGVTKEVSPHSLRHTHAHNLRLKGYSLEATSYRLGHADVKITTRYTRPAELARAEKLPAMPWAIEGEERDAQARLL